MKKILIIATSASVLAYLIVGAYFLFRDDSPITVLGAPASQATRDLIPDNDSQRFIGTTTPSTNAYLGVITDELCLTGDVCRTTWPGGGSSNYDAWTHVVSGTSATSTEMRFTGGFLSTASSTFTSQLNVGGVLNASSTGLFGTGLTVYSGNSVLAGGTTITCTGCVTDVNVADIALGSGTSGNYVLSIADAGNTTVTVVNGVAEGGAVTLDVIDVNCSSCLGTTEIGTNLADLTATNGTLTFSGAYDGSTARTVGLNLGNSNEWTASTTIANSLSVSGRLQIGGNINASSTATSTFANGIQINAGCIYKVSTGACLSEVPTNLTGILEEAGGAIGTITIGTGLQYVGTTLSTNLANLSVSGSITGTTYNGTAAVSNWALNMANSNTWTVPQYFSTASSTGAIEGGGQGGVTIYSMGSGVGTIGFNSLGYAAGVTGYGALMQLAPSTGVFTLFSESNVSAGVQHSHITALTMTATGALTAGVSFASPILNVTGTATSTFAGGIFSSKGLSAMFVEASGSIKLGTGSATSSLTYSATNGGELDISTSTTKVALATAEKSLFGITIPNPTSASTTIMIGSKPYAFTATHIAGSVFNGTNCVVSLTDGQGNATNQITLTPTSTSTPFALTSNNTFTRFEGISLNLVSCSAGPNQLNINIYGTITAQ